MQKVCHFSSAHPSDDPRILYKECASLARAGYDVYFVTQGEDAIVNGVKVIGAGAFSGTGLMGKLKRMFGFSRKVFEKAVALDCDIYHLHDPELLQYVKPLKRMGKKVIFDCHEDYANDLKTGTRKSIPKPLWSISSKVYSNFERRAVRDVDAVITVNEALVEKFKNQGCNVALVTNFPLLKPLEDTCKREENSSFEIVFMGKQPLNYEQSAILRAIADMDDVIYRIYGADCVLLEDQLKDLPGFNRVRLMGRVPFDQSFKHLQNCNAGIGLPVSDAFRNTIGNTKIFEYMMAALPVIWSSSSTWDSVIVEGGCGITVDPLDEVAIKNAIEYLKDNSQVAELMGKKGRLLIERDFSWESQELVLIDLYSNLTGCN